MPYSSTWVQIAPRPKRITAESATSTAIESLVARTLRGIRDEIEKRVTELSKSWH